MKFEYFQTLVICLTIAFVATQVRACAQSEERKPRIVYNCEDAPQ